MALIFVLGFFLDFVEITTGHIYAGVAPFIGLQIVGMALLGLAPVVSTWLPGVLY